MNFSERCIDISYVTEQLTRDPTHFCHMPSVIGCHMIMCERREPWREVTLINDGPFDELAIRFGRGILAR